MYDKLRKAEGLTTVLSGLHKTAQTMSQIRKGGGMVISQAHYILINRDYLKKPKQGHQIKVLTGLSWANTMEFYHSMVDK